MTRTLPWLNKGAATKPSTKSSSPAPTKRRKRSPSPSADLVDSDLNNVATPPPRPKQKQKQKQHRSPSPAAPVPAPPDLSPMRPGYKADDIWIMVEDEFNSTAKDFTRHIHWQEYQRLRKLARSRGEKVLAAVGHGMDGGRTERSRGLELRMEREAGERRREGVLGGGGGGGGSESEEEEDAYMLDPQLAGLMMREKNRSGSLGGGGTGLAGLVKAKSNTRAAAGFAQSPHAARRYRDALDEDGDEEEKMPTRKRNKPMGRKVPQQPFEEDSEDDKNDLDAAPAPVRQPVLKKTNQANGDDRYHRASTREASDDRDENVFKRFAAPSKPRPAEPRVAPSMAKPSPYIKMEEDDDGDLFPRARPRPTYKKAQNREASQALSTRREEKPKTSPLKSTGDGSSRLTRPAPPSHTRPRNDGNAGEREEKTSISPAKKTSSSARPQGRDSSSGNQEVRDAASGFLARREAARAKEEKKQQGRTRRVDEIPTFLF